MPRSRVGSLPFPGMFTLYDVADPERLGPHQSHTTPGSLWNDETERGTLYTMRAGFLDLAHLRIAIDYTRFCAVEVRRAIGMNKSEWSLAGPNGSVFHLQFNYPQDWSSLPTERRQQLEEEVSIRCGARLAYLMLTWHEVASWFGYRTVFFVDESQSAFTYDDSMAHLIGARVAAQALHDRSRPFDEAVTVALRAELRNLQAATPEQTRFAVEAVRGKWWAGGEPLRRQTDVGLTTGVIEPWLAPDLPFARGIKPRPFALPNLYDLLGVDAPTFCEVAIEPRLREMARARAALPDRPTWFDEKRDLPELIQMVATEMRKKYGPDAVGLPRSTPSAAGTALVVGPDTRMR